MPGPVPAQGEKQMFSLSFFQSSSTLSDNSDTTITSVIEENRSAPAAPPPLKAKHNHTTCGRVGSGHGEQLTCPTLSGGSVSDVTKLLEKLVRGLSKRM